MNLPLSNVSWPSDDEIRAERLRRSTKVGEDQSIDASKARCRTLVGFIREAWHILFPDAPYIHGWHIDELARHLEAITHGEFLAKGLDNRFLANVPPGTMKSLAVSVFWPAWEWGPEGLSSLQYIATSYREDFCLRDSRRFRALVTSDWFQERWSIDITSASEHRVENARTGWREAIPFGSLTGGRCDRLLIDDPHSVDTAESDADRARATMRFRESASQRVNDPVKSAIIVIMQRLHQADISGVIMTLKLPYVCLMLPMEFEPERKCITPFGGDRRTEEGELLFPERFPRHVVDRDQTVLGAYATAGQHQQRPSPRGGLMFKRVFFPVVDAAPAHARRVRGWDLAASEARATQAAGVQKGKKKSSGPTGGPAYTCGLLMSRDLAGVFYIEDVQRVRMEPGGVKRTVLNIASQDEARYPGIEIDLPQDPGQAGKAQARDFVGSLAGHIVRTSPESGDKIQRAEPVQAQAEAGNIKVVKGEWNEAFFEEIELFPAGTFKDQVDAMSRAFARLVISKGDTHAVGVVVFEPLSFFGDNTGGP